jgi:hypothetical protein
MAKKVEIDKPTLKEALLEAYRNGRKEEKALQIGGMGVKIDGPEKVSEKILTELFESS